MSEEFNIIGDVAGRFDTLQALLAKMPAGAKPLSVGDMVDRGPKSLDVLKLFMNQGEAVLGNHEHLMLDYLTRQCKGQPGFYEFGIWQWNGGVATIISLADENGKYSANIGGKEMKFDVPDDVMNWLQGLPLYKQLEGAIVTHAPLRGDFTFQQIIDVGLGYGFNRNYVTAEMLKNGKWKSSDDSMIWNRGRPRRKPDIGLQIHGHNSFKEVQKYSDDQGMYAMCIDTCRGNKMTGIHWPSGEIFEQEFLEPDDDR